MFLSLTAITRNRKKRGSHGELGYTGSVCIYDNVSGTVTPLKPNEQFEISLPPDGVRSYIVAPVGRSGIAFFGDGGKFVSTGKQRISRIKDEPGRLTATVLFAGPEKTVELHGYAAAKPSLAVRNGTAGDMNFDPASRQFVVEVSVDQSAPAESADSVRSVLVEFSSDKTLSK